MSVVEKNRLTVDDLLKMPDGDRYELVDGALVEQEMGYWSSMIAIRIARMLGDFCEQRALGYIAGSDAGFGCFPDDPEKVRRPDVTFIRRERLAPEEVRQTGVVTIAPDLAVEVLSPNDSAYAIAEKVDEYLRAGVTRVWVVNPADRSVAIYRAEGAGTILRAEDELSEESLLPGLHVRVSELFKT